MATKIDSIPDPALYRQTLIDLAGSLVGKASFTKEDGARAALALNLSREIGMMGSEHRAGAEQRMKDCQNLSTLLRTRNGYFFAKRDLAVSDPTIAPETSVFAAWLYLDLLTIPLATTDALFDERVVTLVKSPTGAPLPLPSIDVLDSAAQVELEGALNLSDLKTVINAVPLGQAPCYRTPTLLWSRELDEDTGWPLGEVLAETQGLQFALGIGPDLVSKLLADTVNGCIASGSADSTGDISDTGSTTIGWQDLISLRTQIQPAYRVGPKCGWLCNDNTLAALDAQLDKSGRPIYPQIYNEDERRVLQGFPVFISPSMPDISPGSVPLLFGNFKYFIVRLVKESVIVRILRERYALQGQVGAFAKLRCNGALLGCVTHGSPAEPDAPVKFLQMGAE